jgi:methionyl-tRNA formyltransferase
MNARKTRIVFMGTPEFAVPSLQFLMEAGYPIAGVITSPDKQGGRGMKQILQSPVKTFSLANGLNVLQPENLKSKDFINALRDLDAGLQVVVAFRMLPEIVWSMPQAGTMNLHASLLPAYRGAAPIQRAIMNGDTLTGLTTFLLQHEIDSGNIIAQREIPILPDDDAGTLHDRMMHVGAGLVLGSVDMIDSGQLKTHPQDLSKVTHAPKIHHEDAHINWNSPVKMIHNLIRAMSPYPGAWTSLDGSVIKILRSRLYSDEVLNSPGKMTIKDKKVIVQGSDGELEILELQPAGRKRMGIVEFLNGFRSKAGLMT